MVLIEQEDQASQSFEVPLHFLNMADQTSEAAPQNSNPTLQATDEGKAENAAPQGQSDTKITGHSKKEAAKTAAKAAMQKGLAAISGFGKGLGQKSAGAAKGALFFPIHLMLSLFKGNAKFLSFGLIISFFALIYSSKLLYQRFIYPLHQEFQSPPATHKADDSVVAFFKRNQEMTIAYQSIVFLERFSTNLTSEKGNIIGMEFEVVVECDSPETSKVLKEKKVVFREAVSEAIQGKRYEDIVADETKAGLKSAIKDSLEERLRTLHSKGLIKRVFFTRFVLG